MSNELPQAPTEMCDFLLPDSDYVGQKMSLENHLTYKEINGFKPHKYIDIFNQRTGRIKRMRSRREGRYVNLAKRVGKRAYSFSGDDYPYFIKRWTRH